MSGTVTNKYDYVYSLDFVRFGAACMVALFHFSWRLTGSSDFLPFGWVGVQIFFVISGFVIANSASGATTEAFLESRFLRLYPAAWTVGFLCTIVQLLMRPGHFFPLRTILYTLTLLPIDLPIATAYWTLPVEIAFYLAVAILIFSGHFEVHVYLFARLLALWSMAYLLLVWLQICGTIHAPYLETGYGVKNMTLVRHGIYFAVGMMIWLYRAKRLPATGWIWVTAASAAGYIEILDRAIEVAPKYAITSAGTAIDAGRLAASGFLVFLVGVFLIFTSFKWNNYIPQNPHLRKFIRNMGLLTYPIYLLHEEVGSVVLQTIGPRMPVHLMLLFSLIATMAIGLLISMWVEPILRRYLRQRIGNLGGHPKPVEE